MMIKNCKLNIYIQLYYLQSIWKEDYQLINSRWIQFNLLSSNTTKPNSVNTRLFLRHLYLKRIKYGGHLIGATSCSPFQQVHEFCHVYVLKMRSYIYITQFCRKPVGTREEILIRHNFPLYNNYPYPFVLLVFSTALHIFNNLFISTLLNIYELLYK